MTATLVGRDFHADTANVWDHQYEAIGEVPAGAPRVLGCRGDELEAMLVLRQMTDMP